MEKKLWNYDLRTPEGGWLGQVVLTSDGMFASVTDYGNLSFAWRSFGEDFRTFVLGLNTDYFGDKMYTGLSYISFGKKQDAACKRFAEKILPALQEAIKKQLEMESLDPGNKKQYERP